ncbi:DUF2180 family protein [Fodinicola feengrottensis]|uniref:DUF2180 family protein n=1 Tax=Fodinicola feengrottensis TaxID=435914 RepID=UPI0031D47590
MNCLDCNGPAVAICTHCGAGTCRDHTIVTIDHLTRTVPLNRQIQVEPAARRIRCHACETAVNVARQTHAP